MLQGTNVVIQADGMELTDALRQYTESKFRKLDRYGLTNLKVLMKLDGLDCVVEVIADDTFVSSRGADMYHTIVKSMEVVSIALEKAKGKRSA